MRERISKHHCGKSGSGKKEVTITINKSGLSAKGEVKYAVAVRFAHESVKKISKTGFAAIEIDREMKRLYFVPEDKNEGYRISCPANRASRPVISFTVNNIDEWRGYAGEYDLCKDVSDGSYYVDLN